MLTTQYLALAAVCAMLVAFVLVGCRRDTTASSGSADAPVAPTGPNYVDVAELPQVPLGQVMVTSDPKWVALAKRPVRPGPPDWGALEPPSAKELEGIVKYWDAGVFPAGVRNFISWVEAKPREERLPWLTRTLRQAPSTETLQAMGVQQDMPEALAMLCELDADAGWAVITTRGIKPEDLPRSWPAHFRELPPNWLGERYEPYTGILPATRTPEAYRAWVAAEFAIVGFGKYRAVANQYYEVCVRPGYASIEDFADQIVADVLSTDDVARRPYRLGSWRNYAWQASMLPEHWEILRKRYLAIDASLKARHALTDPDDPARTAIDAEWLETYLDGPDGPDRNRAIMLLARQGEAAIPRLKAIFRDSENWIAPSFLSLLLEGRRDPELAALCVERLTDKPDWSYEVTDVAMLAAALDEPTSRAAARDWVRRSDSDSELSLLHIPAATEGNTVLAITQRLGPADRSYEQLLALALQRGGLDEFFLTSLWEKEAEICFDLGETGSEVPHDEAFNTILRSPNARLPITTAYQYMQPLPAVRGGDQWHYVVYFTLHERAYFASIGHRGDWYNGDDVQRVVNQVMADEGRSERLIYLNTMGTRYLLADPAVAIPIAHDLGLNPKLPDWPTPTTPTALDRLKSPSAAAAK